MEVVSPTLSGGCVQIRPGCRKDRLPPPLSASQRVLARQGTRGARPSRRRPRGRDRAGCACPGITTPSTAFNESGSMVSSIRIALPTPYSDLVQAEIEILDSQTQSLEKPQPGSVQQPGNELLHASHTPENRPHLIPREYHREAVGLLGSHQIGDPGDLLAQDFTVEKQQRRERLVLGRCAHSAMDGETGQKRGHLAAAHLGRMPYAMKTHVALDPAGVGLLRPATVMPQPQRRPHLPQELHGHTLCCKISNGGIGFARAWA